MKAVIVDLLDGYAAALRDDGRVVKLPDAGYALGQVIEVHERMRPHWRRTVFSLAAAAALLLSIGGAAYAIPYGTVTLDADSSIQYTINMFDYVLDVQAENEEGETLLSELDTRRVLHHRVDSAISSTMQQIERRGYFDDPDAAVLVSADTWSDRHTDKLHQELEIVVNREAPPRAAELTDHPVMPDTVKMPVEQEAVPGAARIPDAAGEPMPGEKPFVEEYRPDTQSGEGEHPTLPHELPDAGESAESFPYSAPVDPHGDQGPDSSKRVPDDRRASDFGEGFDFAVSGADGASASQGVAAPDMLRPEGIPAEAHEGPGFGSFAQPGGNQPGADNGWSRR